MRMWEAARRRWTRMSPRTHDVGLMLVALTSALTEGSRNQWAAPDVLPRGQAALVLGLLFVVPLWWRRRYPLPIAWLGVVSVLVAANPVVLGISLFTLAIRRRDVALAVVTAAGYAAVVTLGLTVLGFQGLLTVLVSAGFGVGLSVVFGAYIGVRRDLVTSLRERAARAEAERELRAEQARLSERSRIAREMHDVLAHKVSLIALHAGGLEVNPASGPEHVAASAALIRTTARQALEDLRGVLGALRTDTSTEGVDLAPQPTYADLPRLVTQSREAGVSVVLDAAPLDLPDAVGRTVYRVVQEALTNVHKHARGAATRVGVRRVGDAVEVEVVNAPPVAAGSLLPGSGAGLVGLGERVGLLGGRFEHGPTPDGGWRVHAVVPHPVAAPTGPSDRVVA